MKKYNSWFVVLGFCAFIALMASGFVWLLGVLKVTWAFLNTIRMVAHIIMTVIALASGWLWLRTSKMNHTLRVVLEVFFVIFAIMAILGVCGVGF